MANAVGSRTKPYSGPRDPGLPDHVTKLSPAKRSIWVRTFNGVLRESGDEGRAMTLANNAVRLSEKAARAIAGDEMIDFGTFGAKAAAPKKTEDGRQFSASDYADIGDPEKPSTWKLRLGKTPGSVDADTVADAITALQPGGFRGNVVQLGSGRDAVVRKLGAAIGKLDDEDAQKRLRDRLAKVKSVETGKEFGMQSLAEKALALAEAHGHDVGEKCDECAVAMPMAPPLAYGGATSFDQLDAFRKAQDAAYAVGDVVTVFRALMDNVLISDDETEGKTEKIAALSADFAARVRTAPRDAAKALADEEKAGRRMGKPQLGMFGRALNDLKSLLGWASYDDDDDDEKDEEKKELPEFLVFRTKDGLARWLTFSSNAFEDHEGELFETKALEDAVLYADVSGERGPLRIYHVPGADVGHCDFQAVAGRMLVESGTFDDSPLGRKGLAYFERNKDANFGVSIGYWHRKEEPQDGTYGWLRIKERSITPPGRAANPFTSLSIGGLPMVAMNAEKLSFLEEVFGAAAAKAIVETAERQTKELEAAGIRHKDDSDGAAKSAADAAALAAAEAAATAAGAGGEGASEEAVEAMKELVGSINALTESAKTIPALQEAVKALQVEVVALKKSDDEKIAAMIRPRSGPSVVSRPTEGDKNLLDPEKAATIIGKNKDDGSGDGVLAPGNEPVGAYVNDFLRSVGVQIKEGAAAS